MVQSIQRFIFKSLSLENYLRLLQRSYFMLYGMGILKMSDSYSYHYYVKNLIHKGDTVLDIGANLGYYSILFARWVGKEGKVYAVEPIATYNKIYNEKAQKYDNITLLPYALGTEERTIELVSSPQTGYLRTGLPHVYDSTRDGKLEEQEFRFEAQMRQPSKLFADLEKINYIKCDIEGFEYIVLKEMKALIEKHKPKVQVEVWGDNERNLYTLFTDMGYKAYKLMDKKLTGQDTLEKSLGGDYIFIHQDDKR